MGLKVPIAEEKPLPAVQQLPRWRVPRRDELAIVPIAILVFCFTALLVDAVLGGRGRVIVADRIAAVVHGAAPEIAVGSIRR
jgi:hypothetical protein